MLKWLMQTLRDRKLDGFATIYCTHLHSHSAFIASEFYVVATSVMKKKTCFF